MDQAMLWVTIVGIIVIPVIGAIFNSLITNKIDAANKRIDDLELQRKTDKQEFYNQFNGFRASIEANYVRRDIYQQAVDFHRKENDKEFDSLLTIVNTKFSNMEDKVDGTNQKIEELKKLINEKFNGNHK